MRAMCYLYVDNGVIMSHHNLQTPLWATSVLGEIWGKFFFRRGDPPFVGGDPPPSPPLSSTPLAASGNIWGLKKLGGNFF